MHHLLAAARLGATPTEQARESPRLAGLPSRGLPSCGCGCGGDGGEVARESTRLGGLELGSRQRQQGAHRRRHPPRLLRACPLERRAVRREEGCTEGAQGVMQQQQPRGRSTVEQGDGGEGPQAGAR